MAKTRILVIGRNVEIADTVLRLVNQNEKWSGFVAYADEEAKRIFLSNKFDLVLLGGGIEEGSETDLRKFFSEHQPGCLVIQHYGGGSGLLSNEIYEALGGRKKGS